ncbi:MAG: SDR family oxidoreductase [Rickettsia hoogstraalii]
MITGASNGIGKSVSQFLAQENYHVVLIARNKGKLNHVCEIINSKGGSASCVYIDVTNCKSVSKTINSIFSNYSRIDVLFNSAGVAYQGTSDISIEEIDEMVKTNLLGTIYFCKYVAEYMKKQRSGYIFNLSSLGGKYQDQIWEYIIQLNLVY